MAAAGLPEAQRRKAVLLGIAAAAILRIGFAIFTVQLLAIIGLTLAGGILLAWVAWKLWRELRAGAPDPDAAAGESTVDESKTFGQALFQIILADVSMSLDNVLAVAGAARDHTEIMIIGLALSVALMGIAATWIARVIHRHRWIAYVGLIVIAYVAAKMMWDGGNEVMHFMNGAEHAMLNLAGLQAA